MLVNVNLLSPSLFLSC